MKSIFINQKGLFFFLLLTSILMCLSSSSILGMWMSMEINLFSFIPLMASEETKTTEKSLMLYFMNQAIASIMILVYFTWKNSMTYQQENYSYMILLLALILKLGMCPFHTWFLSTIENLSWNSNMILMTLQKLIPLSVILMTTQETIMLNFMILNSLMATFMGLTLFSMRKIMGTSSMNHLSLMTISIIVSKKMFKIYFLIYSISTIITMILMKKENMNFIFQTLLVMKSNKMMHLNLLIVLMSMAGLPPFLGFLPKIILMTKMISLSMLWPTLIILLSNSMATFFYLRMTFSNLLMSMSNKKWKKKKDILQPHLLYLHYLY